MLRRSELAGRVSTIRSSRKMLRHGRGCLASGQRDTAVIGLETEELDNFWWIRVRWPVGVHPA